MLLCYPRLVSAEKVYKFGLNSKDRRMILPNATPSCVLHLLQCERLAFSVTTTCLCCLALQALTSSPAVTGSILQHLTPPVRRRSAMQ
jgi:hypothetical protein